jgi:ferric-dicitrate binding protein FerR (iron transport regulator)
MSVNLTLRGVAAGVAVLALAGGLYAAAAEEKTLTNLHGSVSYIAYAGGVAHELAPAASIALSDDDVAETGHASMGTIAMPDSSRIVLASDTIVKLDAFSDADVARAHFIVSAGKLRFRIEHPAGAKADYTFTTPTGEIGVRGTEGDMSVDPMDGVRVNVYHLGDPASPVRVTMLNGVAFQIFGGQKIWMRWQSGKLIGKVQPLTKAEIDRFQELGAPTSVDGGAP